MRFQVPSLTVIAAFAVGGCGDDSNANDPQSGVSATLATTTGLPETTTPPGPIAANVEVTGEFFEVTFDGSACRVTGPAERTRREPETRWLFPRTRSARHLPRHFHNGLWFCAPLLVTEVSSTPVEIIEVSFDGSVCTTTGPAVASAGVHPFVLTDLTGEGLADVRTMTIADDHSYQDLLDLQSEEGEYVTLPPWAEWPPTTFEPVERELAENEIGKMLILEPGEHGIAVGTGKGTWFCGALQVTDS